MENNKEQDKNLNNKTNSSGLDFGILTPIIFGIVATLAMLIVSKILG